MSRYYSYFNSAIRILEGYEGKEPFAHYIKKSFATSKKFGSKDRKQIAQLCYSFFRPGKALQQLPTEQQLIVSIYLSADESNTLLNQLNPEFAATANLPVSEKLKRIPGVTFSVHDIFPWINELSELQNPDQFVLSHFVQPDLFLRARPGREHVVKIKLENNSIGYQHDGQSFRLSNNINIDKLLLMNQDVVIQDMSSQRIRELMEIVREEKGNSTIKVWDCCAASGGKSILACDVFSNIDLVVSDIRDSIISNLKKRFKIAGIFKYRAFVADITRHFSGLSASTFDLIIADVPCTGSGTWGRTPEQMYFFSEEKIKIYSALQKEISGNCVQYLKPGGFLLYITCSVFRKENEENVEWLLQEHPLTLLKKQTMEGYGHKADTMFAALFVKINQD